MPNTILTRKQIALMKVILAGNTDVDGNFSHCDLDQIIQRVEYSPTKHAIHFSIRKLIAKGLIEKLGLELRRESRRVIIGATKTGKSIFSGRHEESYIEPADEFTI